MLQELGILPPASDEHGRELETILSQFDSDSHTLIRPFMSDLARTQRATSSILGQVHSLRNLLIWVRTQDSSLGLLQVNEHLMQEYLAHLHHLNSNPKFLRDHFAYTHRFYRWCLQKRLILSNPCRGIEVNREQQKLPICSPEQVRKLYAFIKNPSSPPESALLISLVLFYGLTTGNLAFAQLGTSSRPPLQIVLRRKQRTHGRRYFNRPQVLKLSDKPNWFVSLQKKFLAQWQHQYAQVKKTYPYQPLTLCNSKLSNRPLSPDSVLIRFKAATAAATGAPIPVRVIRQTCGHLQSSQSDASVLTHLGWSPQFAFHYTWLPRVYFGSEIQSTDQTTAPHSSSS
jgi:hypothetical protein